MKFKKVLATLLALTMIFCIVPISTFADVEYNVETKYEKLFENLIIDDTGIYIGDSALPATAEELAVYGISYDTTGDKPVLTLDNVWMSVTDGIDAGAHDFFSWGEANVYTGMYIGVTGGVVINLVGESKIYYTCKNEGNYLLGIFAECDVDFVGDSLDVLAVTDAGEFYSSAIFTADKKITNSADLTVSLVSDYSSWAYAMVCYDLENTADGVLTVEAGDAYFISYGLCIINDLKNSGTISVSVLGYGHGNDGIEAGCLYNYQGGLINVYSKDDYAMNIGNIENDGTIIAECIGSGDANLVGIGIYGQMLNNATGVIIARTTNPEVEGTAFYACGENVETIENYGTITATAACGVGIIVGALKNRGGTVTAIGGETSNEGVLNNVGIIFNGENGVSSEISGGAVYAFGGNQTAETSETKCVGAYLEVGITVTVSGSGRFYAYAGTNNGEKKCSVYVHDGETGNLAVSGGAVFADGDIKLTSVTVTGGMLSGSDDIAGDTISITGGFVSSASITGTENKPVIGSSTDLAAITNTAITVGDGELASDTLAPTETGKPITISFDLSEDSLFDLCNGYVQYSADVPEWKDYKFLGWFTKRLGGDMIDPAHYAAGNTYYAHWQKSEDDDIRVLTDPLLISDSGISCINGETLTAELLSKFGITYENFKLYFENVCIDIGDVTRTKFGDTLLEGIMPKACIFISDDVSSDLTIYLSGENSIISGDIVDYYENFCSECFLSNIFSDAHGKNITFLPTIEGSEAILNIDSGKILPLFESWTSIRRGISFQNSAEEGTDVVIRDGVELNVSFERNICERTYLETSAVFSNSLFVSGEGTRVSVYSEDPNGKANGILYALNMFGRFDVSDGAYVYLDGCIGAFGGIRITDSTLKINSNWLGGTIIDTSSAAEIVRSDVSASAKFEGVEENGDVFWFLRGNDVTIDDSNVTFKDNGIGGVVNIYGILSSQGNITIKGASKVDIDLRSYVNGAIMGLAVIDEATEGNKQISIEGEGTGVKIYTGKCGDIGGTQGSSIYAVGDIYIKDGVSVTAVKSCLGGTSYAIHTIEGGDIEIGDASVNIYCATATKFFSESVDSFGFAAILASGTLTLKKSVKAYGFYDNPYESEVTLSGDIPSDTINACDAGIKINPKDNTALYEETWDGTGTQTDPYIIKTLEDLNNLADAVNSEGKFTGTVNSFTGRYFAIVNDIGSEDGDKFEKIIGECLPLSFGGKIGGDGHTVWLDIDTSRDFVDPDDYRYVGFVGTAMAEFLYIDTLDGLTAISPVVMPEIRNLTLKGSVVGTKFDTVGAFAGIAMYSAISGCVNECAAEGSFASGIVGGAMTTGIAKCANLGDIRARYSGGGMMSYCEFAGMASECVNMGNIYADNIDISEAEAENFAGNFIFEGIARGSGGMIGMGSCTEILACANYGSVISRNTNSTCGGLTGTVIEAGHINFSYNLGSVSVSVGDDTSFASGIAGKYIASDASACTFGGSYSRGAVIGAAANTSKTTIKDGSGAESTAFSLYYIEITESMSEPSGVTFIGDDKSNDAETTDALNNAGAANKPIDTPSIEACEAAERLAYNIMDDALDGGTNFAKFGFTVTEHGKYPVLKTNPTMLDVLGMSEDLKFVSENGEIEMLPVNGDENVLGFKIVDNTEDVETFLTLSMFGPLVFTGSTDDVDKYYTFAKSDEDPLTQIPVIILIKNGEIYSISTTYGTLDPTPLADCFYPYAVGSPMTDTVLYVTAADDTDEVECTFEQVPGGWAIKLYSSDDSIAYPYVAMYPDGQIYYSDTPYAWRYEVGAFYATSGSTKCYLSTLEEYGYTSDRYEYISLIYRIPVGTHYFGMTHHVGDGMAIRYCTFCGGAEISVE